MDQNWGFEVWAWPWISILGPFDPWYSSTPFAWNEFWDNKIKIKSWLNHHRWSVRVYIKISHTPANVARMDSFLMVIYIWVCILVDSFGPTVPRIQNCPFSIIQSTPQPKPSASSLVPGSSSSVSENSKSQWFVSSLQRQLRVASISDLPNGRASSLGSQSLMRSCGRFQKNNLEPPGSFWEPQPMNGLRRRMNRLLT